MLKPKVFGLVLLGSVLMLLPQLLYWNYLNGSWVTYSYGNEGFNWLNPKLLNTWFSPNNGLFLYTPFYFLILLTLGIMIKTKCRMEYSFCFCSYSSLTCSLLGGIGLLVVLSGQEVLLSIFQYLASLLLMGLNILFS